MSQKIATTKVFSKILKGCLDEADTLEVAEADYFIDQAVEQLMTEEPALQKWLENDRELSLALKANISSIYRSLIYDLTKGKSLEDSLPQINTLIFRVVAAACLGAVQQERSAVGFLPFAVKD